LKGRETRKAGGTLLALLVVLWIATFRLGSASDAEIVPFGEVDVELYVVALDGVGAHGVGSVGRVVEGVLASRVNATYCRLSPYPPITLAEVKINTTATVIHDWSTYREVVERGSNIIIVNAHGETLPVPSGYTKELWADKIAEAMAYRNVTWVHTGGYPLYFYHHQESGEGEWREEGFQRLMSHIGKNNVTCHSHSWLSESTKIDMHNVAYELLSFYWYIHAAYKVNLGKPLYGPDWNNSIILCIWGVDYADMPGAVIKFGNQAHDFGIYVHIGTNKTYSLNNVPTDGDFYRGYMGAAAAIWACAWRFAAEHAILEAEAAIARAEMEGRTKGLDEARQLLRRAEKCFETRETEILDPYHAYWAWANTVLRAMEATETADKAVEPTFLETYAPQLIVLGVIGTVTPIAFVISRRKNSKRQSQNEKAESPSTD